MNQSCVFCRIVKGEIPSYKIYENERVLAFLDINPSAAGHTLIIPKAHVSRIESLSDVDAESLFKTLHRLVGVIQTAMNAPASTIGINNGPESGQEIYHVHIHIIPRSRGDRGGIIQGIARGFRRPNTEEMKEIRDKMKELAENIV